MTGAGAGVVTTAGLATGATGAGAVTGADEFDGGVAGAATGAIGATLEAASAGADAAESAWSAGNTWIGGGGSAGGAITGFCITAAKPKAATNSAMMYHKEFLGLGLSSLSKAEFVDF